MGVPAQPRMKMAVGVMARMAVSDFIGRRLDLNWIAFGTRPRLEVIS